MVEVVFYESIQCPRCSLLRPILERVCRMLNIPLTRKIVDLDPHIWGADESRETFTPEFLEKHAPDIANDPLAKTFASMLSRYSHTPTLVISSNAGVARKPIKILVRGFPARYSKEVDVFERNLFLTLKSLKEVEKLSWSQSTR